MMRIKPTRVLALVSALAMATSPGGDDLRAQGVTAPGWIDTHVHLGGLAEVIRGAQGPGGLARRDPARRASRPGVDAYVAAAGHLVRMMDARGIARAMVVTVPGRSPDGRMGAPGDRALIVEAVRRHPGRLHLMDGGATLKPIIDATDAGAVTPAVRADFERRAEALLDAGAVGFGEMISLHFCLGAVHSYQHTPADHPLFLALADVAARRGVPVDIHMEAVPEAQPMPRHLRNACSQNPAQVPGSLPALDRLLAHNRQARIVWQHVGWDNIGHLTVELLRRMLEAHANLYLSLRVERRAVMVGGGDQPMPNRIVDASGRVRPEWLALLREFPDRIMIGSDEFVGSEGGLTTEPAASFQQTWSMFEQLPPDLARKVGSATAARVYRLAP